MECCLVQLFVFVLALNDGLADLLLFGFRLQLLIFGSDHFKFQLKLLNEPVGTLHFLLELLND
jgi:hypothetical protein